jgi:branched-chain amino acid transport system ATP-binding protein
MGVAKSFQITNVFPQLSTRENIRIGLQALVSRYDMWRPRARLTELTERADELLALVGLWESRERTAKTLAHGEQRALEIGMALASQPRLLLLDEPTAGMSPEETRVMMDLIVKLASERTVILVEHKMKLVLGISDRILVLHHGELLAEGTPSEVRQNEAVKRVYLGQREH